MDNFTGVQWKYLCVHVLHHNECYTVYININNVHMYNTGFSCDSTFIIVECC